MLGKRRDAEMDRIDRKILDLLQQDGTLSVADIGQRVGLSQTPCWKRIQRLEAQGVIQRRVALLDPEKLGLGLTVFVCIEAGDHSQESLERFATVISTMSEVVEFHRMAGDVDYLLRVVVPDVKAYDLFYKRLIGIVPLKNVSSRFSVERVKSTTALPIEITV
jgi:Lrp/AsnC family transcriptional regulator